MSDHNFGFAAEPFLPGVFPFGVPFLLGVFALAGETFGVAALLVGVSPALLRIAAVSLGVAPTPCMARIATAFLKSSGGEAISFFGVVVNFAFFALTGDLFSAAGDLLAGDLEILLAGVAGLSGVAYLAGDTALSFGDLPGDFFGVMLFGLFAGDLLFGLLAGDFLGVACLGLFAGDLPFGLLAGDFLGVVLFTGDFFGEAFLGLFPGDLLFLGLFAFTGLSSRIASVESECLLMRPLNGDPAAGADFLLRGVAPRLRGVDAGSFLSNSSGLNLGPNDTLFLFDAGSTTSMDFLFCPGLGDLPTIKSRHNLLS